MINVWNETSIYIDCINMLFKSFLKICSFMVVLKYIYMYNKYNSTET